MCPGAARADRDLDAVVGLFDAAAKFADRLPQAGPEAFLVHIGSQDMFIEWRWNPISAHGAYTWYMPISLGLRYF